MEQEEIRKMEDTLKIAATEKTNVYPVLKPEYIDEVVCSVIEIYKNSDDIRLDDYFNQSASEQEETIDAISTHLSNILDEQNKRTSDKWIEIDYNNHNMEEYQ
jgi:hypothetical protein